MNHVAQYYTPPSASLSAPPAAPAKPADAARPADSQSGGGAGESTSVAPSQRPAKRVPGVTRIGRPSGLQLVRPEGDHLATITHTDAFCSTQGSCKKLSVSVEVISACIQSASREHSVLQLTPCIIHAHGLQTNLRYMCHCQEHSQPRRHRRSLAARQLRRLSVPR